MIHRSSIVFRVDAALIIGTGHVMRCLALADELRTRGANCVFVSRSHEGHLCNLIRERGFKVLVLAAVVPVAGTSLTDALNYSNWLGTSVSQDAVDALTLLGGLHFDWVVVDHYGLDAASERILRSACRQVLVIDDLADRPHDCDVLLDQNPGRLSADYDGLLPAQCERLIGPRYALLRPDFARLRPVSLARRAGVPCRHILVTMGGVDKDNMTSKILAGLNGAGLDDDFRVTVVLGANAPWVDEVRYQAQRTHASTQVLVNVPNMAELMCEADLAIGAAGSTSWERCCMGLPTILLVLAENQRGIAEALGRDGIALCANGSDTVSIVRDFVRMVLGDPSMLVEMSRKAAAIVDGLGVSRVADRLMGGVDALPSAQG